MDRIFCDMSKVQKMPILMAGHVHTSLGIQAPAEGQEQKAGCAYLSNSRAANHSGIIWLLPIWTPHLIDDDGSQGICNCIECKGRWAQGEIHCSNLSQVFDN